MEDYCAKLTKSGKQPFEVVFSAPSIEDVRTRVKLMFPNAEIVEIRELYKDAIKS